jgi:glyoxylase-like metal-dependent hydrolase (beta-lactamase superfamily II)
MQVAPGIESIQLPMPDSFTTSVNVYLIRDNDGFVLVDTGLEIDDSRETLVAALGELGTTPDDIHTVVSTHGHHDHYGLAAHLGREHGTRVWLHESDWAYIQLRYGCPDSFRSMQLEWLTRYGMPEDVGARATRSLGMGTQSISLVEPDRTLSGGETLDVGPYHFEVQWTPGHTPGHVCLLDRQHELLFSGDHILPSINSNVSLQPYSSVNPLPGYLDSLRELATMPIRLTMPGHGDPMPTVSDRVHQIAQHQLKRRERLLDVITTRAQTPYELAAFIWAESKPNNWDQFPDFLRRNAVGTLIAHLEQLADEGLVSREEDQTVRFASLAS